MPRAARKPSSPVASVIDALGELAKKNVGKKGPGVFVLPGLLKIVAIQKPAVKARKGINPFTKQEQMFKAKPAENAHRDWPHPTSRLTLAANTLPPSSPREPMTNQKQ